MEYIIFGLLILLLFGFVSVAIDEGAGIFVIGNRAKRELKGFVEAETKDDTEFIDNKNCYVIILSI